MRDVLDSSKVDSAALKSITNFHTSTVAEVNEAVAKNKIVVVGMSQNPVVRKARKILNAECVAYSYLEYGSYFSGWKRRLAIKLWSGWPTFPQIFIDGKLIGGCDDLIEWKKKNSLKS